MGWAPSCCLAPDTLCAGWLCLWRLGDGEQDGAAECALGGAGLEASITSPPQAKSQELCPRVLGGQKNKGENLDVGTFGDHRGRTAARTSHKTVDTCMHTHAHTHTPHQRVPFPRLKYSTSALAQISYLCKAAPYK